MVFTYNTPIININLGYFIDAFIFSSLGKADTLLTRHKGVYYQITAHIDKKMQQSAYSEVSLARLFLGLAPK